MENTEKIWNRRFILLFITNLLVLAAFYASIPIIPVYCAEIGITGSKVGVVLTAMSIATVLFRPVAGYLLDNFNRYRVYLLFLALFCLSFPAFLIFPVFGLLIIYCLKSVSIFSGSHGIPELISILLVVVLHLWKRQMLLSIAGGTICYMLLVQLVF